MKFTTNLLSSNTLTHLKKCTFLDFEDFRLKDFADGVHSLDEKFPEFVELFRQVEKQLIFENMLSSEMFITIVYSGVKIQGFTLRIILL